MIGTLRIAGWVLFLLGALSIAFDFVDIQKDKVLGFAAITCMVLGLLMSVAIGITQAIRRHPPRPK